MPERRTLLLASFVCMTENPVLIITGASTGIGAKTAHHAAEAGYRLVLSARSEDKLEALASELGGPDKAIAVRCDVSEWEDCENLVKAATDAFGGFDAVFANAGLRRLARLPGGVAGALEAR